VSTDMVLVADLFAGLFGPGPAGDWQQLALCAEADPELFYPEARETTPEAKTICMVSVPSASPPLSPPASRTASGVV
jgi:hypothetical protein